eukprot:9475680-Pyramimonas_sp.AAC.1
MENKDFRSVLSGGLSEPHLGSWQWEYFVMGSPKTVQQFMLWLMARGLSHGPTMPTVQRTLPAS